MGWFYGLLVAFASFIHIASICYAEHTLGKESSVPATGHHLNKRHTSENHILMNSGTDSSDAFDIQLKGGYFWKRLRYIDNRKSNEPYYSNIIITEALISNYSDLSYNILTTAAKKGQMVDKEGVVEVLALHCLTEGEINREVRTGYQRSINFSNGTKKISKIQRKFDVIANSVGEMFQLIYMGPGLFYASTTTSTEKSSAYEVTINCRARQIHMLKDIKVVVTDHFKDRPINIITETFSLSPDINQGFGDKHVWLVPIWTTNKNHAATTVRSTAQNYPNDNYENMATSKYDKYRYLEMVKDHSKNKRVEKVGLLRSAMSNPIFHDIDRFGWHECTTDINIYRIGDFLHLCWVYVDV